MMNGHSNLEIVAAVCFKIKTVQREQQNLLSWPTLVEQHPL